MEKIGILGGTFNPIHVEHIRLAKCAIEELGLDKLIVMPTFIAPHKLSAPAPAQDRIKMLKLAFEGIDKVEVSDFEIQKGGKSYTYLTVEHFQKLSVQVYFIVGGDMLVDFKNWRFPERILKSCKLAVFSRDEFYADFKREQAYFKENFNTDFIKLNYVGKNVSSTKIRVYSAFSLSLNGLVPEKVENYIKDTGLYGGDLYVDFVKTRLPEKRVRHTANVVITALKKAKELGLDEKKVMIAATLHDCAKYFDHTKIDGFTIDKDVPSPVIHQFLGAFVAENILGITDQEVLDAIRYHTSGKANMSLLGKLIFVADMVEEDRNYEGVDYLRGLYEKDDFEFCFRECLREEMLHLQNKGQKIYAETISAYDYYIKGTGDK